MVRKFGSLIKIFFAGWMVLLAWPALAQNAELVRIEATTTDLEVLEGYQFEYTWSGIRLLVRALQQDGYLLANADSVRADSVVRVTVGEQYRWAYLGPGNVHDLVLRKVGFHDRLYHDKPFRYAQIGKLMNGIIAYEGGRGYPFAQVKLDSVGISGGVIRASLSYTPGPYITFDSLRVQGSAKVNHKFLYQHLQIFPERPYSEQRVEGVSKELNALPFLEMSRPPELSFQNSQATVHLNLNGRPANRLDFVLGMLPNSSESGKMLLTGQLDFGLRNLFGRGKSLDFNWLRYKEQSSNLHVNYGHPYLLGSVVNAEAGFELLREDSTFISRLFSLGFNFKLSPQSVLHLDLEYNSSDLLNPEQFRGAEGLPDISDVDVTYYGLKYTWNDLDHPFFPRKGKRYELTGSLGDKRISPNLDLSPELYDSIDLRNIQARFQIGLEHYLPLHANFLLYSNLRSGMIINENIFLNEMFRIGGFSSLRGFNENFFFASAYGLSNLEGRVYLDRSSYLFLLYDQAYIERNVGNAVFQDFPLGLGLGLSLGLKSGIFNFALAVGRWKEEPFSFDLAKVHVGYTNVF